MACNYLKETLTQVFSWECCEIFKNSFFYRTPTVAAFSFQNHPDLEILQIYQLLSNQSFNHNLAHIPFSNLTGKLSF